MKHYVSPEDFLKAPIEEVIKVAPKTLIFAAGGTRRSAVLAGISVQSDDYVNWSREHMIANFDLFFRLGVTHLFTYAIVESQLKEVTGVYRERLLKWVDWGLAGPETLSDYHHLGWRVRLLGTESFPQLRQTADRLAKHTASKSPHTLWWSVVPSQDSPWEWALSAITQAGARTRQEAIRALYGEDIPLATLFLSFGKPFVSPALIPPLLMGKVQCYWTQRPGYRLTEEDLRMIFYDYAYTRATWRDDKLGRAESVLANRIAWEQGPTIGLGVRLGQFWYPVSFTLTDGMSADD